MRTTSSKKANLIANIAFRNGYFPETLWNHPANSVLRSNRASGYVLSPGDILHIPTLHPRSETCATGQRHRFRRKGVPARLQVRLIQEDGRPFADLPYQLLVNGDEFEGRTDGDGFVRQWVPPEAAAATLLLETENTIYEYALRLHRLVPASSDEGLMQRLENLGYLSPGERDHQCVGSAVLRFQRDQEIEAAGNMDEETRRHLMESHGC